MSKDNSESKVDMDALAQRMARLLGLPTSSIQVLLPQISPEELGRLVDLKDDQFLRASTRLIQQVQAEQFAVPPPAPEGADSKTDTTIKTKSEVQAEAPAAAARE